MSYILDALKRAESERSRGAVPTIHAAPAAMLPAARAAGGRGGAVAAAAVLLIGAVAAAIWWAWPTAPLAPAAPPTVTSAPAAAVPAPAAPMAANSPAPIPAPAPPMPMPAPAVVAEAVPAPPQPASAARAKPPARKPVESAAAPRAAVPRGADERSKPASASTDRRPRTLEPATASAGGDRALNAGAQAAASAAPAVDLSEERIYSVRELPEAIRSSLPVLTVAGATYSENPASRMLIVNGRLAHEGDAVAPEVTLQQIKLRTAVLSFRGYRYFINY